MIAVSSSGSRFDALAGYLESGHRRREHERVAWSAGRNLPSDDPVTAAVVMRATAEQNRRVAEPMYHLVLSAPAGEPVSRAQLERIADRVLVDLGLREHQALLVAHRDKEHAHVHVMVNRVHPETRVAWSRWQDQPQIQATLREMEYELGLTPTPGRLYQRPGQVPPERPRVTRGEQEQAERTGRAPLVERARARLSDFREAVSWADLEQRLATHGLQVDRRGQGLVITDGETAVKASRIARDVSLRRLEERLGVPYDRRHTAPDLPPEVARLARDLRVYDRLERLHRAGFAVETEASASGARHDQLATAIARAERTQRAFEQGVAAVYRDPSTAAVALQTARDRDGTAAVLERLRTKPETFGALATVERARLGGLWRTADDAPARAAAVGAAGLWQDAERAEQGVFTAAAQSRRRRSEAEFTRALGALYADPGAARTAWDRLAETAGVGAAGEAVRRDPTRLGALTTEPGTPGRSTRYHAEQVVALGTALDSARHPAAPHTERTAAEHDAQRAGVRRQVSVRDRVGEGLPQLEELGRVTGRALARLAPHEFEQLRAVLTAPHVAIATRLRAAVRDVALGHEEEHER